MLLCTPPALPIVEPWTGVRIKAANEKYQQTGTADRGLHIHKELSIATNSSHTDLGTESGAGKS